jgi:hypothetical protein
LGVTEDSFESFMSDIYKRCNNLGLTPESIASYLTNLVEFSKTVPLSLISEYIQQKADEKNKLEEEIQKLKDQIKILNEEKSSSELRRTSALNEEHMTRVELKSYSDLKKELGAYGISIDKDIPKFVKLVEGIGKDGYDVDKVISEFSDIKSTRNEYWSYQESMHNLKKKYDDLNQECSILEQHVKSCNQKLCLSDELKSMGFGLKELKMCAIL